MHNITKEPIHRLESIYDCEKLFSGEKLSKKIHHCLLTCPLNRVQNATSLRVLIKSNLTELKACIELKDI